MKNVKSLIFSISNGTNVESITNFTFFNIGESKFMYKQHISDIAQIWDVESFIDSANDYLNIDGIRVDFIGVNGEMIKGLGYEVMVLVLKSLLRQIKRESQG